MDRPNIICHMVMSLNGKVTGTFLEKEQYSGLLNTYFDIHGEYKADAFLCGRTTFENSFPQFTLPIDYGDTDIERNDYVGNKADFYAIIIDTKGKLYWERNYLVDEDGGYNNARIIEVLTENVSDNFLAHLREKNISYIFAGEDVLDIELAVQKLYSLYGIKTLLLEGGGVVNGVFLEVNIVDELSLIVVPVIEHSSEEVSLFETGKYGEQSLGITSFIMDDVQPLQDGGLWITYKREEK